MSDRHWWVVSPEYDYTEPVLDDGSGPTYTVRDVASVAAPTKREAIRVGVAAMKDWPQQARWAQVNPFAGVTAEDTLCPHGVCMCDVKGCDIRGDQTHSDYCETCAAERESVN